VTTAVKSDKLTIPTANGIFISYDSCLFVFHIIDA